jgi:hypothetical protein
MENIKSNQLIQRIGWLRPPPADPHVRVDKMKTFKTIILYLCCLISVAIIGYSGEIINKGITDFIAYPLLLVCSVAFLHWFFWHHFVPLSLLSKATKAMILEQANIFYTKGFSGAFIFLGYFCIFIFCFKYFIVYSSHIGTLMTENFVFWGISFIAFGVLSKTYGILRYLIKEKLEQANTADRLRSG